MFQMLVDANGCTNLSRVPDVGGGVLVRVGVAVGAGTGVFVRVGVALAAGGGVFVRVAVGVAVGTAIGVFVRVGVGVHVGTGPGVLVRVGVHEGVYVAVDVGTGVMVVLSGTCTSGPSRTGVGVRVGRAAGSTPIVGVDDGMLFQASRSRRRQSYHQDDQSFPLGDPDSRQSLYQSRQLNPCADSARMMAPAPGEAVSTSVSAVKTSTVSGTNVGGSGTSSIVRSGASTAPVAPV
jgi:hypothetical protein